MTTTAKTAHQIWQNTLGFLESEINAGLQELETQVIKLEQERTGLIGELEATRNVVKNLENNLENERRNYDEVKEERDKFKVEAREADTEARRLSSELVEAKNSHKVEMKQATKDVEFAEKQAKMFETRYNRLEQENNALKDKLRKYEQR